MAILTNIGEEWLVTRNTDGTDLDIGLYNDDTDSIGESDDVGDITTEPSNSNYSRQTETFSAKSIDGDWGFANDDEVSFDFSDQSSSEDVDYWFLVANFESEEAGDSSANDHLIATGQLSQTRDIGSIDTLNLNSDGAGVTVS